MDIHIFISGFSIIILIAYCLRKWGAKGDIFHPALLYSLINGGMFIVFAFGPYIYKFKIPWFYYYAYALIMVAFVAGVSYGQNKKIKKNVKDLSWSNGINIIFYILLIGLNLLQTTELLIKNDFSLENSGANYFAGVQENRETGTKTTNELLAYIISNFLETFNSIVTAICTCHFLKKPKKNGFFLIFLLLLFLLQSLFSNYRSVFFKTSFPLLVSAYVILKNKGFIDFSKINWNKNLKYTVPFITLIIILISTVSYFRSFASGGDTQVQIRFEQIETLLHAERKPWFDLMIQTLPESITNPLAEISMYAGGTIALGGLASNIVQDTGLHTWGLRNLFTIHRIFSQLRLDAGLSNVARMNFDKIQEIGQSETIGVLSAWYGDPGNWIIDFGYGGGILASWIVGSIIGWVYGRIQPCQDILKPAGTSLIGLPIFLSPASGIFGLFFSNSINILLLIAYIIKNNKKRNLNYPKFY